MANFSTTDYEAFLPLVNSELWPIVEEYCQARLIWLRSQNDTAKGDELAANQGAIKEIKELAKLRTNTNQASKDHKAPTDPGPLLWQNQQ